MRTSKNKIRIAHRGLWDKAIPENSIPAFEKCVEKNVPIELDVHLLKDGTLAVFHDDNLERMTGKNVNIRDLNCKDLQSYTLLNTEHKIPLFREVLDVVKGRVLIDIELKCDVKSFKICREIVKLLDEYDGSFYVKSFNPLYILWFRLHRPNYERGILVSRLKDTKMPRFIKWAMFKMYFNVLAKPDFIAFNKDDLPNKKIEKLYKKGTTILLWTVRNDSVEYDYDGVIYEETLEE